jgi:hypothetical protein
MGGRGGPILLEFVFAGAKAATIPYEVIAPKMEAWAVTDLKKKVEYGDDRGRPQSPTKRVYSVAVQVGQEHIILTAKDSVTCKCEPKADMDGKLIDISGMPFIRVVCVTEPVAGMTATTDDADNLVIQYTSVSGRTATIHLNEKREPN